MQQIKGISRKSGPAYDVWQSLLFDNGSLDRNITTPVSGTKMTLSCWVKLGAMAGSQRTLFYSGNDSSNHDKIALTAGGNLYWNNRTSGSVAFEVFSSEILRDPSAWYHLCFVYDSDGSVAPERRVMIYINGEEFTNSVNQPPSAGLATKFMSVGRMEVGTQTDIYFLGGYMAEVYGIQGEALGPEHFALTDSKGVYNPIPYTGEYGTNGFYLPFEASDIGADKSGNDNDFTLSSITSDSVVADSPTNNYCTLNPNFKSSATSGAKADLTEGNLKYVFDLSGEDGYIDTRGTFEVSQGKWYMEAVYKRNEQGSLWLGWADPSVYFSSIYPENAPGTVSWDADSRELRTADTVLQPYGNQWQEGDIIGVAFDCDNYLFEGFLNGVSQGSVDVTYVTSPSKVPFVCIYGNKFQSVGSETEVDVNFGQRSLAYTPPSGYKALCTQNLPDPLVKPKENFSAMLYDGSGSTQSVSGVGFPPNLVWLKNRLVVTNHGLFDSVRGGSKSLRSDETAVEGVGSGTDDLYSFDSDGFSLGSNQYINCNSSGSNYISWNFRGGDTVTNNDGSIPSEVSANKDMGFSVVKWTQNLQQLYTIGHGLGKIPDLIITKKLTGDQRWEVYSTLTGVDNGLVLNDSAASATMNTWGSFQPTDKVFMFTQTTGDYIAYCFTNTEMLQVGSYTGNGSDDGTFVSLPFKPAFLLLTSTTMAAGWQMVDNGRSPENVIYKRLLADLSREERDNVKMADFLSNGFKCRYSDTTMNGVNQEYLYLAISEQPFKYARGR